MKILVPITYYAPHWTGLTALATNLCEGLARRGHEVTVLTSQYDRSLPRVEERNGVLVLRVRSVGQLSRTQIMPSFPLEFTRLLRGTELLHVHSPMPEIGLLVAIASVFRLPTVITHQGDIFLPAGLFNRAVRIAMDTSTAIGASLADRITTLNEDYRTWSRVTRHRLHKSVAAFPPIRIPEADRQAAAEWRSQLGLTDVPVVGFAGRFVEEKGFDVLLSCLKNLRADLPGTTLVFAGQTEVPYEDFSSRCKPLIEEAGASLVNVGLLSDRARLAQFYAMCDVFALPSRTDCLAAVQIEALLSGTPVVATDIPGARSVVNAIGMGRLVPPNDADALATALADELRLKRQVDAAQVRKYFDPDVSIDWHEAVFAEVVRQKRFRQ